LQEHRKCGGETPPDVTVENSAICTYNDWLEHAARFLHSPANLVRYNEWAREPVLFFAVAAFFERQSYKVAKPSDYTC
jgi:hypothetical protein